MSILALDLGTNLGWAVFDAEQDKTYSGCFHLKSRNNHFEGAGVRYLRFVNELNELHKKHKINFVGFEEVRAHSATTAGHIYGGFLAILAEWCERKGIPYIAVPVGTIKKHATGDKGASKMAMIEAAHKKGHLITNDNEADALHILYLLKDQWVPAFNQIGIEAIRRAVTITGENR